MNDRGNMMTIEERISLFEKNARPDDEIDTSDIPPLTEEELKMFRPRKEPVTIRLDLDCLTYLRKNKGWQTRLNDYIREGIRKGEI